MSKTIFGTFELIQKFNDNISVEWIIWNEEKLYKYNLYSRAVAWKFEIVLVFQTQYYYNHI